MKATIITIIQLIFIIQITFADGLLMPKSKSYPKDFLRNKVTDVTVNIHGLIAETIVYQEFYNESDMAVDAVYSFPLPENARSTDLLYWRGDTIYKAILKVQQQTTNPGTGEGGIAALVNKYLGRNGLKIELQNIAPRSVQKVELHYISILSYYNGNCSYDYPLDTKDFVKFPVDYLRFKINVTTNQSLIDFDIPTHPEFEVKQKTPNQLSLIYTRSKAYPAKDFNFFYKITNDDLNVDFYSFKTDTADGHFSLFVRPQTRKIRASMANRIIFLLGNSSKMAGYKLDQSIAALNLALDDLRPTDYFNIILFNSQVSYWQPNYKNASDANTLMAKEFLKSIKAEYGSDFNEGLKAALNQFNNNPICNSVLAFTDGQSLVDPKQISELNKYKTGIFIIGIGNEIDRSRIEMVTSMNYGFATYLNENDDIKNEVLKVYNKINRPVLKDISLNFNKEDVNALTPQPYPTIYEGSYFYVSGRYKNPGTSQLNLSGIESGGEKQYNFNLNYSGFTEVLFSQYLWAKETIDQLEREIMVYGEKQLLKDSLIKISLTYNMRCRYTAYVADYKNAVEVKDDHTYIPGEITDGTTGDDSWSGGRPVATLVYLNETQKKINTSCFGKAFPNPLKDILNLKLFISSKSEKKVIKIYDSMGHLIQIIDLQKYSNGVQTLLIDFAGFRSGLYILLLCEDDKVIDQIKVSKF